MELLGARELWRTRAPPKVKMFFWLALHRRLWMAARRKRHDLQESDACALCDQHPETVQHLFLGYVFARQVWLGLLLPLQLQELSPLGEQDIATWWIQQRRRIDVASRPLFDSLFLLVAWCIWKERNARMFSRSASTPDEVVVLARREGSDWAFWLGTPRWLPLSSSGRKISPQCNRIAIDPVV